jgi:hypothetical protein
MLEQDKFMSLEEIFNSMRGIQLKFLEVHGVNDIWSNSKIFEVLQANTLGQKMIPGHSGSLDARDEDGREYEYKHFKETSSNHSWTFNDYSDQTIKKLASLVQAVVFTHIDDTVFPPIMDWSYTASGPSVSHYLAQYTKGMKNARRMINISASQLEVRLGLTKDFHNVRLEGGFYGRDLVEIFELIRKLESLVGVENILTSNKFWEVLVSLPLGHTVNSEQGGRAGAHDAFDENGGDYEYKVSSTKSWNFQDISPAVLEKYLNCEQIVLAIVDKTAIRVKDIWVADSIEVVKRLRTKLGEKGEAYAAIGKEVRRQQVSLSAGDLERIKAQKIL